MSWLNLAAASSRETSVVLILINLFAILRKTSRCRKSGSRLATRLIGVPFGIISDLDVTIAIGESPQRPRYKFLAQMQRAIVLCAPDGIFIQPFFRPE